MTRFILTFDDIADPAPDELGLVRSKLRDFAVEQVTPGVLSVTGAERVVQAAAGDLTRWKLKKEVRFSSKPPHRSRLKQASA